MRKLFVLFTFVLGLAFMPSPAQAEGASGAQQALVGLNGTVTAVADPVLGLLEADDRFDLPGNFAPVEFVTDRVVGLFTGTFTGVKRLATGVVDLPLALTPIDGLSPNPRFIVVPGAATSDPVGAMKPPGF